MITQKEIKKLYEWGLDIDYPLKKERIVSSFMNCDVKICYFKYGKKKKFYPNKSLSNPIIDIIQDDDIYSFSYIKYPPHFIAKPHRDYNPYDKKFTRIQIPLRVPSGDKCYVENVDGTNRIYWKSGKMEIFDVEELHQGANNSDEFMEFLYVDINPETVNKLSH